jgi:uncharacterized phage protein gp47/JayE
MATYSLADLLSPETAADALDVLLTDLAAQGFPTTAWDDFEPIVGLLRADARALSSLLALLSVTARAGLVELSPGTDAGSPGDWLSLLAENYGLTRAAATYAKVRATVSLSPTASPYTLTAGGLTIEHVTGGLRYRYVSNPAFTGVIAPGGSLAIELDAEVAGRAYNRALGQLVAPIQSIPGMTVVLSDVGGGTPMVVAGVDAERDSSLRARMRTRWDTIGLQKTSLGLEFLARNTPGTATPVTRVSIDALNPRGTGTVDIWIATDAGPALAADVALVNTYVRDRSAIGSDVLVQAAEAQTIALACTVRAPGAVASEVAAALALALDELVLAIPLGGTLYLSQLVDVLQDESLGVRNVDLSTITIAVGGGAPSLMSGDITLASLSYVAVPIAHTITVLG